MTDPSATRMDESVRRTAAVEQPGEAGGSVERTPVISGALRDRLVRLAYRFLWDRHDAEDAVHDALISAQEHAGTLRDSDRWWSWIQRIVVHRCRERGRQTQRKKRHENLLREEAGRRTADRGASDLAELRELIPGLLQELPQRQHEVMVLRHLQDMPYDQIAELLGISPSTARVQARAGRESLRSLLLQRHPEWFDNDSRRGGTKS